MVLFFVCHRPNDIYNQRFTKQKLVCFLHKPEYLTIEILKLWHYLLNITAQIFMLPSYSFIDYFCIMFMNNIKYFFGYAIYIRRNISLRNVPYQLQYPLESWFWGNIKGTAFLYNKISYGNIKTILVGSN